MIKYKRHNGFTLAETLITIGIIGVLAVILLSILKSNHQNRDKILYLKTYMRMSTIVSTLLNDEDAYPNLIDSDIVTSKSIDGGNKLNYIDYPFFNTYVDKSVKYAKRWSDINTGEHNSKLCRLIADSGYHVDTLNCSDENAVPEYSNNLPVSFSTQDGIDFYVYTNKTNMSANAGVNSNGKYEASYKTIVYFDTDGKDKGNNCIFNKESCKEPDIHKIMITADGKVYPMDPMSLYYTKNSKDTKKHEYEEDELEEIANLASSAKNETVDAEVRIRPKAASDNQLPDADDVEQVAKLDGTGLSNNIIRNGVEQDDDDSEPDNDLPSSGIVCNSVYCRYDCTKSPLDSGYGDYTAGGGCQDGTAIMYLETKQGTHDDASKYCQSLGLRLPTTQELSAASNFNSYMNFARGNYWAEQNDKGDTRSGTYGYVRNCYMPDGNCGVHSRSDKTQRYRCVAK